MTETRDDLLKKIKHLEYQLDHAYRELEQIQEENRRHMEARIRELDHAYAQRDYYMRILAGLEAMKPPRPIFILEDGKIEIGESVARWKENVG